MSSLAPSTPMPTARQMRRRMLAQRIDSAIDVQPAGPAIPPVVVLASSFGTYPTGQVAIPALSPSATYARYMLGG